MKPLPAHGDRALCANCKQAIEVTAVAHYQDTGKTVLLCKHTTSGRMECQPDLWDRIDSRVDYDDQGGTMAKWPL